MMKLHKFNDLDVTLVYRVFQHKSEMNPKNLLRYFELSILTAGDYISLAIILYVFP